MWQLSYWFPFVFEPLMFGGWDPGSLTDCLSYGGFSQQIFEQKRDSLFFFFVPRLSTPSHTHQQTNNTKKQAVRLLVFGVACWLASGSLFDQLPCARLTRVLVFARTRRTREQEGQRAGRTSRHDCFLLAMSSVRWSGSWKESFSSQLFRHFYHS